jgi:hypothetical protein
VLLTILEELIEATTDDLNTQEEIKTNALEGKINARIVFALPWFVLPLLVARVDIQRNRSEQPSTLPAPSAPPGALACRRSGPTAQASYWAASIAERNTARCLGGRHCAVHAIACTSVEPVGATDRQ